MKNLAMTSYHQYRAKPGVFFSQTNHTILLNPLLGPQVE